MTSHQVSQLLLGLAAIIILARTFGAGARLIGQPPVVGEILAGILAGPTLFGTTVSDALFPAGIRLPLAALANVGLVLFMFIVGYELDHRLLRGKERVAISVSIGSIVLPFGLGAALALWLATRHDIPRVLPFVLFLGAAMSVTAFPVLARILTDRRMHRIQLGGLALASAAVDDVIAWSLLAVVVTIAGLGADQWHVLVAVPYVLGIFFVVRPLLRRLIVMRRRSGGLGPAVLAVVLVGLLLSGYATEWMGIHFIFGAFLFGAVMPRAGATALRREILERVEHLSVMLLLPVFFVLSGMKVDLSTLDLDGLVELSLILAVAIGGKFVGAFLGARLQGVRARPAGALATLMNTRGLTELVILTVGLQLGILDGRMYSLMVVMALVTTAMAGPLLAWIYPRRRVERDIAAAEAATLGATKAYRALVVLDNPAVDDGSTRIAADLVGERRPGEVVLSHLVPFGSTGRLEVGSGLSGELLDLTRAMGDLDVLAAGVRARGLSAPVLARFSADPAQEVPDQVTAARPDIVVVAARHPSHDRLRATAATVVTIARPLPKRYSTVVVRLGSARNDEAALRAGALIAASREAELVVEVYGRMPRRITAAIGTLVRRGLPARARYPRTEPPGVRASPNPAGALLIAADGADQDGAHLLVRAEPDAEPPDPASWVPALPRPVQTTVHAGA